ncbi:hypothetical protein Tco_0482541 [Tanacetum coccineum]
MGTPTQCDMLCDTFVVSLVAFSASYSMPEWEVALDDALVALDDHDMIGKCNMRIDSTKTQKEATYQVVLDTLKLNPCYNAFLITADVLEIYMHHVRIYVLVTAFTGSKSGKKLKKARNTSLQFCGSALAFSMVAFETRKILKAGKKQAK